MSYFHKLRSLALCLAMAMAVPMTATAIEYRKCSFDVELSAAEKRTWIVPNSDFVAWARATFASTANKKLNELAQSCVGVHFGGRRTLPTSVSGFNHRRCNSRSASSGGHEGLSGFRLGDGPGRSGNNYIRSMVCAHPGLGKQATRTTTDIRFDKRVLTNFTVVLKSRGGVGRCDSVNISGPVELTVLCRMSRAFLDEDSFGTRRWKLVRFVD